MTRVSGTNATKLVTWKNSLKKKKMSRILDYSHDLISGGLISLSVDETRRQRKSQGVNFNCMERGKQKKISEAG